MIGERKMIDRIELNVPLNVAEVLFYIGHIASKMPYQNGEGLKAEALCKEIAGKIGTKAKVEVPLKAVDIVVKIIDAAREAGNKNIIVDIDKLITLLKGGLDRKITGVFLKGLSIENFKEMDDGKLKTELIIDRPETVK